MRNNDSAISPVIGVMLMLVVTIIIAALVSAFSGGAVSGTQKAPQAVVQATYSQSSGMTITNSGGDAIPLESTTIMVQPSRTFGSGAARYSWIVNKSYLMSSDGITPLTKVRAFKPGDTATISKDNLKYVQQRPDLTTTDESDSSYGFTVKDNVGLSFTILFLDSGGKTIGQGTVTITS